MKSRRAPAGSSTQAFVADTGDSLTNIAENRLGNAALWHRIAEENPGLTQDANVIPAGVQLRIPGGQAVQMAESVQSAYTVQRGDSLTDIAARLLGDPARYVEIFDANRHVLDSPSLLRVGQVLTLPGGAESPVASGTPAMATAGAPPDQGNSRRRDMMFVQSGDTLSQIAKRYTGDAGRWQEIWDVNRDRIPNPNRLSMGESLDLPSGWQALQTPDTGDHTLEVVGEMDRTQFRTELYTSLARYEGGDPAAVHYDSGRVNVGKGSWTGGHIVRLMKIYEEVALENTATEQLYAHFGSEQNFRNIQNRFSASGAATTLTGAEENYFRSAGRDPLFISGQNRKGGEDVENYLNSMRGFQHQYPWLRNGNEITQVAATVFAAAGHQSGSPNRAFQAVRAGRSLDELRQAYGRESAFLEAIADKIVAWVQPHLRRGVRNRYNSIMASYSYTATFKL